MEEIFLSTYQTDITCTDYLLVMLEVPAKIHILELSAPIIWARGGAVGWGAALQVRMLRFRFPMESLGFFIGLNCRGNQNTRFMFSNCFSKIMPFIKRYGKIL
jgi:hypothetical protein